jgi:hypothetical protein
LQVCSGYPQIDGRYLPNCHGTYRFAVRFCAFAAQICKFWNIILGFGKLIYGRLIPFDGTGTGFPGIVFPAGN